MARLILARLMRERLMLVSGIVLGLSAAPGQAETFPVGPTVPTDFKQCWSLHRDYDQLIRRSHADYKRCDAAQPYDAPWHVAGTGRCASWGAKVCRSYIDQCEIIQDAQTRAVTKCQQQVRQYLAWKRSTELDERGSTKRSSGLADTVSDEVKRALYGGLIPNKHIERYRKIADVVGKYTKRIIEMVKADDPYDLTQAIGLTGTDAAHDLGFTRGISLSRALTKLAIFEAVRRHREAVEDLLGGLAEFDRTMADYGQLKSSWHHTAAIQESGYAEKIGADSAAKTLVDVLEDVVQATEVARGDRLADYEYAVAKARRNSPSEPSRLAAIPTPRNLPSTTPSQPSTERAGYATDCVVLADDNGYTNRCDFEIIEAMITFERSWTVPSWHKIGSDRCSPTMVDCGRMARWVDVGRIYWFACPARDVDAGADTQCVKLLNCMDRNSPAIYRGEIVASTITEFFGLCGVTPQFSRRG